MGNSLESCEFLRGTTVFRRGFYEGVKVAFDITKEVLLALFVGDDEDARLGEHNNYHVRETITKKTTVADFREKINAVANGTKDGFLREAESGVLDSLFRKGGYEKRDKADLLKGFRCGYQWGVFFKIESDRMDANQFMLDALDHMGR